jgi:hypothetical protein
MKLGWEKPRRIERLKTLSGEKPNATFPVVFQNALKDLPIRTIALDLPKYRLNNGRTEADQVQYLAKHPDLAKDLFTADLESDAAQQAQHEILKTMTGAKGLLPYFREHAQEEPLILTATGFVLNGNRRLCAFRSLYEEDKKAYEHFANIRVVILPSGDERDLDRLESRLQRESDIRADYPWYADAVKYRRRLEEFGQDELSVVEGVGKEHIIKFIAMLELAEQYLEYRETPFQYASLSSNGAGGGDDYYAFEQLVKNRKDFKDATKRETFIYVCFAEMLKPKGSAYQTIPKIADHFEYVEEDLDEAYAASTASDEGAPPQSPATIGIAAIFGGSEADDLAAEKLRYTKALKNAESIRDKARGVVSLREFVKIDKKKQNYVVEQIRKATTLLKEANNAIQEGTKRDGVAEQLSEAEIYVAKLRTWSDTKP